ncbi:MAG: BMP family ABC transporter substrate-binding protein [Anaerolineales bacterium]|nr:BMP family ABC transporter substrate-binding protein [Anaerolineales bacterium]
MKKLYFALSLLLVASFALGACGPAETTEAPPEEAPPEEAPPTEAVEPTEEPEEPEAPPYIACQVSDTGGTDDKSFNQYAWIGMVDAQDAHGVDIRFLESTGEADYEPNINAFVEEGCDMIFGVGFLLNDATTAAAQANPDVYFVGIDHWSEVPENYLGTFYNIHEATMLTGYLAAGMSETGIVGVYAGINIPPVTAFSDGFYLGIQAYNEAHGTDVQLLGWDPVAQDGLFTGDFFDTDKGRTMTETLLDAGADIIMPVAGPVGAGSLAVFEERDAGLLIGVDTDWSTFYPDQAQYVLASALKRMDLVVFDSIAAGLGGTFEGGNFTGTLENGRVGIQVGSQWLDQVPAELMEEIQELAGKIISGEVSALYERAE